MRVCTKTVLTSEEVDRRQCVTEGGTAPVPQPVSLVYHPLPGNQEPTRATCWQISVAYLRAVILEDYNVI